MMNKKKLIINLALGSLLISPHVLAEKIDLTIYQVMQRVLDKYPTLKISDIEVAQAAEQRKQVESSLGWVLNSSGGVTHDLTALGTPSDRLDVTSSIARQLKSGATLSLSGGYRYEDSSLSFNPALPNPAHTTKVDLSYRLPLSQGGGNPLYVEGLKSAEVQYKLTKANDLLTKITLAENVKNIFYKALSTKARLINAIEAVERTKKLEAYINKNVKLGLSEKKDKLQIRAQLHSKQAELSALQLQWNQEKTSINRLMLEDWNHNINPIFTSSINSNVTDVNKLIDITKAYHPAVVISQEKLILAESQINSSRDNKKDNLDLVVSVGSRTSDGKNNSGGTVSEQDWAGSVSLQYKHLFDDDGITSKYKQALLEKNIAQENIIKTHDDISYTVSGLSSEIKLANLAVKTAFKKLNSESLKLREVEDRFKNGRADTAQVIQFQNEYSFAQLAYQNQKVDLHNRIIALQIFTGKFWNILDGQHIQAGENK